MGQISQELEDRAQQQIKVYLEAARYLTACGKYDAGKFEHVQSIMAKVGASMSEDQKQAVLNSVHSMLPKDGLDPWDQIMVMEHQSLAEGVMAFSDILKEGSPNAMKFMSWVLEEMNDIQNLIKQTELDPRDL